MVPEAVAENATRQPELLLLAGIADGITRAPSQGVSTSKSYKDLKAWQASMTVVEKIYAATRRFPNDERFGLTSQLRRACVSMPANVAEGRARRSDRAFANHVSIALGSHAEAETCLEIARRLGYLTPGECDDLMTYLDSAGQLLSGLFRLLNAGTTQKEA